MTYLCPQRVRVAHTGKALLAYGKLNPGRIWWEADVLPEYPELPLSWCLSCPADCLSAGSCAECVQVSETTDFSCGWCPKLQR